MQKTAQLAAKVSGLAIAILLMASCSTVPFKGYKGPDLPPEKTAIIEPYSGATIVAYDGEKLPGALRGLALSPGAHTIEISFGGVGERWIGDSGPNHLFIEFKAREGHEYWVRCDWLSPTQWTGYIVDKSTGKRVDVRYVLAPSWALPTVETVIRQVPNDPQAWHQRSNALLDLKRYEEALQANDKATDLKPDHTDAWNTKGRIFLAMKQYEDALKAFDRTVELMPTASFGWYNRGLTLQNMQRYEEALISYDKAIELKSDYADAWNHKAFTLKSLGKEDEATRCFDGVKELRSK
jgi:regulator of sirC expression with transglutaminase-like and TPR domain